MLQDLQFAIRSLSRDRGFAVVALLTLALAIGANSAIFSVINGVLLRPLPYPDPDRIVAVSTTTATEPRGVFAAGDFLDLQRESRAFAALAAYRPMVLTLGDPRTGPTRVEGAQVTASFFDVLGVEASVGRVFRAGAADPAAERLAVLGYGFWMRAFGSDPTIVGRRIDLDGVPHTVTGVLPDGLGWPVGAKVWVLAPGLVPTPPVAVPGQLRANRDVQYMSALGRLCRDVPLRRATDETAAVARSLETRYPATNRGRGVALLPLQQDLVGNVRPALLLLFGGVLAVLLIACANVAGLMLSRGATRQRELAIRVAIGAGRRRLVRLLLTESAVLALAGGAVGLLVAAWATDVMLSLVPGGLPRTDSIRVDVTVIAFTLGASLLAALAFGIVPALQLSVESVSRTLQEDGRGVVAGRSRARDALIVGEIGLTMSLLVVAGLLVNSFVRLQHVNPGFDPAGVSVVRLALPESRYPGPAEQSAFYEGVLHGLEGRLGVRSASISFPSPLEGGDAGGTFEIEDQPTPPGGRAYAALVSASPDYFRTLGVPSIEGRDFCEADGISARPVAIVSAGLARRHWQTTHVIGRRIRFSNDTATPWIEIVGVVGDTRRLGLGADPPPTVYIPYQQFSLPFTFLLVRGTAGPDTLRALVGSAVHAIDPGLPIDAVRSLPDIVEASMAAPRFRSVLLGLFASLALMLASVGLYGAISYAVSRQRRDIAVRLALGATATQVLVPIVAAGLALAAAGLAVGIAVSAVAGRAVATLLFGVGPHDAATTAATALLLLAVGIVASYLPARRVLTIDPAEALRTQ